MESLKNKVVVITGASSGIGAGTAVYLAKQGCRLVLNGRNEKNLKATVQACVDIGLSPEQVRMVIGSVEKTADCERLINDAVQTFGQIDVLVNNAAIEIVGTTDTLPIDEFDRLLNVNLRSVFQLTKFALPHLEKTKGNIINISSVASTHAIKGTLVYGASKAAVDHLSRNMALEMGPKGVRVNCVNPGVIMTEFQRRAGMPQATYDKWLESVAAVYPLRRVGNAEDVAKVVAFLASDLASFTTGETILVDGGHHLGAPVAPW